MAFVPAVLGACGGNCGARLTVVNASERAIASGGILSPGSRDATALGSLAAPDAREYRFTGTGEGAYAVEVRFADGTAYRDSSLGYVTRHADFHDTLVVLPPGRDKALDLRQSIRPCREGPRVKTLLREFLKKVI
jgi:hypothetical protein